MEEPGFVSANRYPDRPEQTDPISNSEQTCTLTTTPHRTGGTMASCVLEFAQMAKFSFWANQMYIAFWQIENASEFCSTRVSFFSRSAISFGV